jgi:hypothetical protein
MMKHLTTLLAAVALVLGLASLASAQVTLTQANVVSAAQATGFTYTLTVTPFGGSPGAGIVVALTCTGTPPSVACTGPSATVVAAGALITGAKTTVTATDPSTGLISGASLPFTAGPAAPGLLQIR